jgi:alanyl-tRNA synthetase
LGKHVEQRGSLVAPERLRFDFSHGAGLTPAEVRAIETEVNAKIRENYPVVAKVKSQAEARAEGAMALFGEKYGDNVRTISIGNDDERYSYELCGGVHVRGTGDIGSFLIITEGSVSSGIRRIEAITGQEATAHVQNAMQTLHHVADQLNARPEHAVHRAAALLDELAAARKQIAGLRRDLVRADFQRALSQAETIGDARILTARFEDVPTDLLREMADWFRGQAGSGAVVLGSVTDGRPQILAAVSPDLTKRGLQAGALIKQIAPIIGGGGGGRPDMAQAGGKDPNALDQALEAARQAMREALQAN